MASALSRDKLLSMYRKMVLIRKFEEKAGTQYQLGKIAGFCHLYIGQEAVAVGVEEALRKDDYVLSAYREHGQMLARGAHPGMCMAELFGRGTGYSKGKGGSMHLFDIENHFYGGYGIVGAQIPMGAGMAFASKYRGEDRVTVCYFGDAASNQGALHETFNMAAKWKLPIIFICENNLFGMGTEFARVSSLPEVYKRAEGYEGMRGLPADGMDVLKMHETMSEVVAHVRAGKGPVLVEALTYRFRGHSMADPANYRTKQEVEEERQRDPIPRLREHILKKKAASEADLNEIDEQVKREVDEAVRFADASPEPDLAELWRDTIVEEGEPDVKPRERVLGASVTWPSYPGPEQKTSWDLEPAGRPGKRK